MKVLTATVVLLILMGSACTQTPRAAATPGSNAAPPSLTPEDVRAVSPALGRYTEGTLVGDVWKRPDLSPRDRSVVTVAALIARNQTAEMAYHFNLALDNGVKPGELSGDHHAPRLLRRLAQRLFRATGR